MDNIPPNCRPLGPYRIFSTRSIYVLAIANAFWFNWQPITVRQIRSEITNLRWIRIAPAKSGFWFKYTVFHNQEKLQVEFFVRTKPIFLAELEFAYTKL